MHTCEYKIYLYLNLGTGGYKKVITDPQNNNKKCGPDGSSQRVFNLRGVKATEARCKQECMKNDQCVAFSAKWNEWCIGCKVELDEPTVNSEDKNAIAFKKQGIYFSQYYRGNMFAFVYVVYLCSYRR